MSVLSIKSRVSQLFAMLILGLLAGAATPARAQTDTFLSPNQIAINDASAFGVGTAIQYPAAIEVTGVPGAISGVSVKLRGWAAPQHDLEMLLVSPSGRKMVFFKNVGGTWPGLSDITFSDDGSDLLPDYEDQNFPTGTYKPVSAPGSNPPNFPAPAPAGPYEEAQPSGAATFASVFSEDSANGTWSLYIVDDTQTFSVPTFIHGGWSLTLTTISPQNTTTTIDAPASSSVIGSGFEITATVVSGGNPVTEGTVTFYDSFTPIPAAIDVPVDAAGQAMLATDVLTEGSHQISAVYNGNIHFLSSTSNALAHWVDNSTIVNGNSFLNPGTITVPNNGVAMPYPSHIFVSGLNGVLTDLTVVLHGVTHNRADDLQVLLVGPTGANLLIMDDVGGLQSISNATLTLTDFTAAELTDSGVITTGTYKPKAVVAGLLPFPPPAPGEPYNYANNPSGTNGLMSIFGSTAPNGTWSLYVLDDTPGAGSAGSISGWELQISAAVPVATHTTLYSSVNPVFSSAPDNVTTLTATVTVTTNGGPVVAGTVTFKNGAAIIAAGVPVDLNGEASCPATFATHGYHSVTASYDGLPATLPSTSAPVNQLVYNHTFILNGVYFNLGFIDGPIAGNPGAQAQPYPSYLFVSGYTGTIKTVALVINQLQTPMPDDVRLLLVGPTGTKYVPMANAGGAFPLTFHSFVLKDDAPSPLPDNAQINPTNYVPAAYPGLTTNFPGVPAGPTQLAWPGGAASFASVFGNTNPNGTWQLYVLNGANGANPVHFNGGWGLIFTRNPDIEGTVNSSATVAPGDTINYSFTVRNLGGSSTIVDAVSDLSHRINGITFSATQTGGATGFTASGSDQVLDFLNMPPGSSVTYSIHGVVDSFVLGTITSNFFTGIPPGDYNPDNNSASFTTALVPRTDIRIVNTDNSQAAVQGSDYQYTVTVTNLGPSDATNVTVDEVFPSNLSNISWTTAATGNAYSLNPTGAGDIHETVFVAKNASLTFTINVHLSNLALGFLETIATATVNGIPDTNSANNTSSDMDIISYPADLEITMSAGGSVVPGEMTSYSFTIVNHGPQTVNDAFARDFFPPTLTNVTYTSSETGIVHGNTSGSGNINDLLVMLPGSSVTYVVSALISSGATGSLTNTAEVPYGLTVHETNPTNNSVTNTRTLTPVYDVSLSILESADPVIAGTGPNNLIYTVLVTKTGPSDANGVSVSVDVDYPGDTTRGVSASAGVIPTIYPGIPLLTDFENGGLWTALNFVGESSATLVVSMNVSAGAMYVNPSISAELSVPPYDGNPDNHSDSETTTLLQRADRGVAMFATPNPVISGDLATFTIDFRNDGPSYSSGSVEVEFDMGFDCTFVSATVVSGSAWTFTTPQVGIYGMVRFTKFDVHEHDTARLLVVARVNLSTRFGISSNVRVRGLTTDPDPSDDQVSLNLQVTQIADLSVTMSDSPNPAFDTGNDPIIAGEMVIYTINARNDGPSFAMSTYVDFSVFGLQYVSASILSGTGWDTFRSNTFGTDRISFSKGGDFNSSETARFEIVFRVPSNAYGTPFQATATIGTFLTIDSDSTDNTAIVVTIPEDRANLELTLLQSNPEFIAGDTEFLSIFVVNNGPSDARGVTVSYTVPASMTVMDLFAPPNENDPLESGASRMYSLFVRISPDAAAGTQVTVSATVSAQTPDPVLTNNTNSITKTLVTRANLSASMSGSPDPVILGGTITYTIEFQNTGPSTARFVTVSAAVPANTAFESATIVFAPGWTPSLPPSGGTGNVVFTVPAAPQFTSATFRIVVRVNSGDETTPIIATATASSSVTDPVAGNNSSTVTTQILPTANLVIGASATPEPALAGGSILYNISLTNFGPHTAHDVTVTDVIPSNLTFLGAPAVSGWTLSTPPLGENGTVIFSKDTLSSGTTTSFAISLGVSPGAPAGSTVSNSVVAASSTLDTKSSNNTVTNVSTVARQSNLAVTVSDSPDPVNPTQTLSYTIVVTNLGPSDCTGATITDNFPIGATRLASVSYTAAQTGGATGMSNGSGNLNQTVNMPVGSTITYIASGVVNIGAGGTTLSNTANVAHATDTETANNSATATTLVNGVDLTVTMTKTADPIIAGSGANNLVYIVSVRNNGPLNETGLQITDTLTLPPGASLSSSSPSIGTFTAGTGLWNIGNLANGATATLTLNVTVGSSAASGTNVTNAASIAATGQPLFNTGDDSASLSSTVTRRVDLVVSMTESVDPVVAGGANLVYIVTVNNAGPSDASNISLSNDLTLPANVSLVSATPNSGTFTPTVAPDGNWTGINLVSGASATLTVTLAAGPSAVTATNSISNTAAITGSNETRINPANDSATLTTSVTRQIDLVPSMTESIDPVIAGSGPGNLIYILTVSNAGPSDASGVSYFSDITMPAGTTFVSATSSTGTFTPATPHPDGDWTGINLVRGASATLTVVLTAGPSTANGTNTIGVTSKAGVSNETRINPVNDTALIQTSVLRNVDLAVTVTDTPDPVIAGSGAGNLVYVATVTNNGPSDASGIAVLNDLTLPSNVTLVSAVPSVGTYLPTSSPDGNWSGFNLAFGASATLTVTVTAGPSTVPGVNAISNTATITSLNEIRINTANDTATQNTTVIARADIAVTKTAQSTVEVDHEVPYSITITNNGPSDAQNVSLTDSLPAGTTFVSNIQNSGPGFTLGNTGANVNNTITTLPAGASASFTVTAHVTIPVAVGTVISNTATGASATTDPIPGNSGTANTTVVNTPPTATVVLSNHSPRTNDVLTATATTFDINNDNVTLTFVWRVNGTIRKTTVASASLTDTFDLSLAGSGNKTDTIVVEVTPRDARGADGAMVSDSAVIINTAPLATLGSLITNEDSGLSATLAGSDVDLDALVFSIVADGTLGHVTIDNATTGAYTYHPILNQSGTDSFTFMVFDGEEFSNTATVTVQVIAVADSPALTGTSIGSTEAGDEASAIALDIQTALTDIDATNDGSESLSIIIDGVPSNATLSNGTNVGGGVWNLAPAELTGLTITVADGPASFTLNVTAFATESSNNDVAFTANTIDIDVFDVDPTIALSGSFTLNSLAPYNLTLGAISDPGTDTVTQYIVHWGDGKSDTYSGSNPMQVSHNYVAGIFAPVISVDLHDEDGLHLNCGTLQPPGFTIDTLLVNATLGDWLSYDLVTDGGLQAAPQPVISIAHIDFPIGVTSLADVGLTLSGTTLHSQSLLRAGQLTITLLATNAGGAKAVNLVITIKRSTGGSNHPQIISKATATPNTVQVGKPVTFTVTATDADGDLLSYYWSFGDGIEDGNSNRRRETTHTYFAPGTYDVVVSVSDGKHFPYQHVYVVVVAAAENTYAVSTFKLTFDFRTPTRSSLIVTGKIPVPAAMALDGAVVNAAIPGTTYSQDFQLNSKGIGGDSTSQFTLKVTAPGSTSDIAKFTLHLKGVDAHGVTLFGRLSALGYRNATVTRPLDEITLPLVITVPKTAGLEQTNNIKTLYKAVRSKTGKATLKK